MSGEHPNPPAPLATDECASHTPGPWTIDPDWLPPEHPEWRAIRIGPNCVSVSGHIGEANARLIVAAPDLLEALKAALPILRKATDGAVAWGNAYEAIAKAEGRS